MKSRWFIGIFVSIFLATLGIYVVVFAADAIAGRVCVIGTTYQQARNAEYDFESDAFHFHVKLNSDGFRERELPNRKTTGTKRVVFVGDSMVFGWGVNADESFVRLAEERLRENGGDSAWDLFNLGVEGSNPCDYRDNLASFGPQLKPDIIVVGFYTGNDALSDLPPVRNRKHASVWQNALALKPQNLIDFLSARFALWKRGAPAHAMPGCALENPLSKLVESKDPKIQERIRAISPDVLEKALSWRVNPYLVQGAIEEPELFARQLRLDNEMLQNASTRLWLREMTDLAKELGSELRLLLIPPSYTVTRVMFPALESMGYSVDDRLLQNRREQETLRHYADELGISSFDLTPILEDAGESAFFTLDPHWTAHGNAVVAEAVSEWLAGTTQQSPAVPCAPPEMNIVRKWEFASGGDTGGWRPASKKTRIESTGEGLRIIGDGGEPSIVVNADEIDCSKVNRLRICLKAEKGRFGRFYWGAPVEGTYPFTNDRVAVFPVVPGDGFRVYDITLNHAAAGWKGTASVFRLDPALLHASEGSMDGSPITVQWIAFGCCVPEAEPVSIWPCP